MLSLLPIILCLLVVLSSLELVLSKETPPLAFVGSNLLKQCKALRYRYDIALPLLYNPQIKIGETKRIVWNSADDGEVANADFPGGLSSTFQGAGLPNVELQPEAIPPLLMKALQNNDIPEIDTGLKSMWEFASGTTRYIFDYNRTEFIESAHETAVQWPTSFYGAAMYGQSWEIESPINRVGGETGWLATMVIKTISSDGRMRRWQWELRKNRRPPDQGMWLVESIGSSDRKGNFEAEPDC